jgi:hypothetical protein
MRGNATTRGCMDFKKREEYGMSGSKLVIYQLEA